MRKLRNILHGFWLLLMDDKDSAALVEVRQPVCDGCDFKSEHNTCNVCGCFLPAKQRVKDEECPEGYWGKHISKI